MMTCKQMEPLLIQWMCHSVPERKQASLQAHLAGCAGCRLRLTELSAGRDLLDQLDALPAPAGLAKRALQQQPTPCFRAVNPALLFRGGLATASLALAAVLGTAALHTFRVPARGVPDAAAIPHSQHSALTVPKPPSPAPRLPKRPTGPITGLHAAANARPAQSGTRAFPGGLRHRPGTPPPVVDDLRFLNGSQPGLMAKWVTGNEQDPAVRALLHRLARVRVQDDFVRVPLPQLAAADPRLPAAGAAVRKYEEEAKVVDPRLYRKITLALKGNSLEEFCQAFEKETGVQVRPARGVADEKLTVFVEDTPARDVMRAVARLFGYFWSRSGAEGAYRYEVYQDLKSQLAEEEMRNRDLNAALLAVDMGMQEYAGLVDLTLDQLKARAATAVGKEKERLERLLHGGWGVVQAYRRLSPAEIAALRAGESLTFSTENAAPGRQLPPEWRSTLFATSGTQELDLRTGQPVEVGDLPDARVVVDLRLKRSELGQMTLEGSAGAFSPSTGLGGGITRPLVVGQNPSVADPDNARANAALRDKPPFTRVVTLRPEPHCPNLKRWYPFGTTFGSGAPNEGAMEAPKPHVASAEMWEEIHRRTGQPIIADYYSRQYDLQAVTLERGTLFEALCRAGDRMGARWHQDGNVILCRSTSYFWDKLKEVPNRLIRRWQADAAEGGLPLRDLLEMASLSEAQLNSTLLAPVLRQCRDLEEWGVVGGAENRPLRPYARFLAQLRADQLSQALSPAGLLLAGLTPDQQREWLRFQPLPPADARLRVEYVPAGAYVWMPLVTTAETGERLSRLPVVAGKTIPEAVAAARKHYPDATEKQFRRSLGVLAVTVESSAGELSRVGKPPVLLLPPGR